MTPKLLLPGNVRLQALIESCDSANRPSGGGTLRVITWPVATAQLGGEARHAKQLVDRVVQVQKA